MTTNTTNSQAASIDTREFLNLMTAWGDCIPGNEAGRLYDAIVAHIDAKIVQAGDDWRDRANVLEARLGEMMEKRDEWRAMAEGAMDDVADHYKRLCKAETKLAEWDRIVEVSLAQDYTTRAISAESRLAEIQRGVEWLPHYKMWDGNLCETQAGNHPERVYVNLEKVLALLQPQGQASDTSGLPG